MTITDAPESLKKRIGWKVTEVGGQAVVGSVHSEDDKWISTPEFLQELTEQVELTLVYEISKFETIPKHDVAKIEFKSGDDLTIIGAPESLKKFIGGQWEVWQLAWVVVSGKAFQRSVHQEGGEDGKWIFATDFLQGLADPVELTLVHEILKQAFFNLRSNF